MIQTYSPEHYSIQTAARQDYQAFYTEEMNYRELMGYPPAEHLMAVLVACEVKHFWKKECTISNYMQCGSRRTARYR